MSQAQRFYKVGETSPDGGLNLFEVVQPVWGAELESGDIVQEGEQVYRVYDGGDKGLRFWNVTRKVVGVGS